MAHKAAGDAEPDCCVPHPPQMKAWMNQIPQMKARMDQVSQREARLSLTKANMKWVILVWETWPNMLNNISVKHKSINHIGQLELTKKNKENKKTDSEEDQGLEILLNAC